MSLAVAEAFLKADITLKKLRNPGIVKLFEYLNFKSLFETTVRCHVNKINAKLDEKAKEVLCIKKIF